MTEPVLTTSWDDGHPLDLRLAAMLARHGVGATFYVPITNGEGRAVLTPAQVRELAGGGFEIGSHTHDHARLDRLPEPDMLRQIQTGKAALEQCLGHAVHGFCYPAGKGVGRARETVHRCGFAYARTIEMFRLDCGTDAFARPTSLHLHPHGAMPLLRNWARQGMGGERLRLALLCLASHSLAERLDMLLDHVLARGGTLHLWGHSWEIEQTGLWPLLDRFFARAAAVIPPARRVENAKAYGAVPCVF